MGGINQNILRETNEETKNYKPVKPVISYEDYEKLDIRICKILSVEKVEKKDRLYKLSIDTGFDIRTVVSSIADKFTPEELQDALIPFILNFPPKKIAQIDSNGMIILAEGISGKLQKIDSKTELGSKVI